MLHKGHPGRGAKEAIDVWKVASGTGVLDGAIRRGERSVRVVAVVTSAAKPPCDKDGVYSRNTDIPAPPVAKSGPVRPTASTAARRYKRKVGLKGPSG